MNWRDRVSVDMYVHWNNWGLAIVCAIEKYRCYWTIVVGPVLITGRIGYPEYTQSI